VLIFALIFQVNGSVVFYLKVIIPSGVVSAMVSSIWKYWSQKKLKEEAEKISYEMKRKYMHLEIKTKNLQGIYPELYKKLIRAGSLFIFFDIVIRKHKEISSAFLDEKQKLSKLHSIIELYFNETIGEDLGLGSIKQFTDYYESDSLVFISNQVDQMIIIEKKLLLDLFHLVKNEIANDQYKQYSYQECLDLLNRAEAINNKLIENKYKIARQMNSEFDPN
jgi:hypothetical protein